MKKVIVIISVLIMLTGLCGFALSFFTGGILSADEYRDIYSGELCRVDESFDGNITSVKIGVTAAATSVSYHNSDEVKVKYEAKNPAVKLTAEVDNGILEITEKNTAWLFLGMPERSILEITLPEKYKKEKLDEFSFSMTSGELEGDLPACTALYIDITSGSVPDTGICADKAQIHLTSGNVAFRNSNDMLSEFVFSATSGDGRFTNICADYSMFDFTSGNVSVDGLAGEVHVDKTSGNIELTYAAWEDDLFIDSTSGSTSVYLPEGSGMDLSFDTTSGDLEAHLEGETQRLNDDGKYRIGGDKVNGVKVDITSGDVYIGNA